MGRRTDARFGEGVAQTLPEILAGWGVKRVAVVSDAGVRTNDHVQSLLAKHFKLVVHRETRVVPLYALVMARADRKPGPMLRSSSADCSPEAMPAQIAQSMPRREHPERPLTE